MTQQNAPINCPDCGSYRKEIRLCLECATQHRIRDRKHPMAECQHDWHREPATPPAEMTAEPSSCMVCGYIKEKAIYSGLHPEYYVCFDCRDAVQQVVHLRAEVERLRHQYSPRCEAHVGEKFDDCPCCEGAEVARLREQVRAALGLMKGLTSEPGSPMSKAIAILIDAALESTTPQEER